MLREEGVVVGAVWGWSSAGVAGTSELRAPGKRRDAGHAARERGAADDHREIDRQLRVIAKRKAGLEIEEARWLREAERKRIWRKLGFSTALEYLEDVFGYSPRTAKDRLRVAKELAELPALEAAVRDGQLTYSAARELTRVMTRDTEAAWLDRAHDKNLRDIEELVAGRKKGDAPDAPKDPALIKRKRMLELSPRVNALFEQSRAVLADELGSHVEDEVLLEALCRCFLAEGAEPREGSEAREGAEPREEAEAREGAEAREDAEAREVAEPREGTASCEGVDVRERAEPREGTASREDCFGERDVEHGRIASAPRTKVPRCAHRIVSFRCDDCSRAWQQSRGRMVELTANEVALVECDAEMVHAATDGAPEPQRATPAIPQRIRNRVWARDQGRCRVPGCRATRNLDIHHIVHRSEGGDHDPANLIVACSGHHKLHHDGLLAITGRAPDQLTFVRDGKILVDARSPVEVRATGALREQASSSKLAQTIELEHAKQALVNLGFKASEARTALDQVRAHVGTGATVASLVQAVLARGVDPEPADEGEPVALARRALVQAGFSAAVATRAVEAACAHVGTRAGLEGLIKEALRWCR